MHSRLPLIPILAVFVSSIATLVACAPAPRQGQFVEIADESAIIIWDSESQTEHFIRRASFKTEAKDFGFLVPSPNKPELAESSDEAFMELARLTAPKVVQKSSSSGSGCSLGCTQPGSAPLMAPDKAVNVLEEKRVAGYDAAVLEATDASALLGWLKDHGYDFSDSLKSWTDDYIKAGWKITAFKIAKPSADQSNVATSSVRMTFKTDKPFYPYREPANQFPNARSTLSGRLLRLFFISDVRVDGALDEKPWPGKTVWTNPLADYERARLIGQLKLTDKASPANWRLTEFEDHSSPRPGTDDVFFVKTTDQSSFERPPHVQYVSSRLPGCLMCLAMCACAVGLHLFGRRRSVTDAELPA